MECGKSLADRRSRLAEVPENMRSDVKIHVRTVFALHSKKLKREVID